MFCLKLTVCLMAAIACVLAVFDHKEIVKITPDVGAGDFKLMVAQNGPLTTVTYQNEEGEIVTEVLNGDGFEVEKQSGGDECLLRRLNENENPEKTCSVKKPLSADQVSVEVAEFCGNKTIYEVEAVQCTLGNANRKKRGCNYTCWWCGGICCGIKCSWSW